MRLTLLTTILLLVFAVCPAQQWPDDTSTRIFSDKVCSLQINDTQNFLAEPVLVLGAGNEITISFDIISEDRDYLRYELVHCSADWLPSRLVDSEFLDGFNLGNIEDYDFSQSTMTHYVHYTLTIPNAEVSPKISGNYLLKIFPENDEDNILLQCRFRVSEQSARIGASVTSRTDVDYNSEHQQLAIQVDVRDSNISDPFNDIIVYITQNRREDNAVMLRQPLQMMGTKLVYEHLKPLVFEAGNEYRRFETVSNYYPGMHVDHIEYHAPYYHHVLEVDRSRAADTYTYDSTQHGRYLVHEYNATEPDTEADYVVVHFSLEYPYTPGLDFYIDGDMLQRKFDPMSKLKYNPESGRYERALRLKQGAYNYQYLALPAGTTIGTARTDVVEGNKYQTVNEYTIYVYNRTPGARYDRLIGYYTIFSGI